MFTELTLTNFKIWKEVRLPLKPVTLLLGTNSSGKSSLIQSLLLIRQTVKGEDPNIDLNLGNPDSHDSVTLGQFSDVLCKHGSSNLVGIEFRWTPTGDLADSVIFSSRYRKGEAGSAELDYLRLGPPGAGYLVQRRKPGIYTLVLAEETKSRGQSADFRPERSFAFSQAALERLGPEESKKLKRIGSQLLAELNRMVYLGPVRRLAQRDYLWNGRIPTSIGDDGSKAVDALIASFMAAENARKRKQAPPAEARLIHETQIWLQKMNLADQLHVRQIGNSVRYELLITRNGETSNLKDVGVGVSQVLPVIVAALHAGPGQIVIVEEPESHLHPLAQSLLAELFAEVTQQRNVQIIAETHSEHLFRRMQTLIARKGLDSDDCGMYFVERQEMSAELRVLKTNEFGAVTNWPDKFFGDALGETREQARLMFERQKQERSQS